MTWNRIKTTIASFFILLNLFAQQQYVVKLSALNYSKAIFKICDSV